MRYKGILLIFILLGGFTTNFVVIFGGFGGLETEFEDNTASYDEMCDFFGNHLQQIYLAKNNNRITVIIKFF